MPDSRKKPRPYGNGSIYWREDRKRWIAQVMLPSGKAITRSAKTEPAAGKLLAKLLVEKDEGKLAPQRRETVAQYLERWLTETVQGSLSPGTLTSYRSYLTRHVLPSIGRRRLTELTPSDVRQMLAGLRGELAPATIRMVRAILHSALQQALMDEIVTRNVVSATRSPRVPKTERPVLSARQLETLLGGIRGHRYRTLYLLQVGVGLRISESLGLRWSNVDWETGRLTLAQQLGRVDHQWVLREFKSQNRGAAQVPAVLLDELRQHRVRQAEQRLAAPTWANEWDLIFTNKDGTPLWREPLRDALYKLLAELELPQIHLHDLRHQSASVLHAAGIDTQTIGRVLGHGNQATTLRYIHSMPEQREAAAKVMQNLLSEQTTRISTDHPPDNAPRAEIS